MKLKLIVISVAFSAILLSCEKEKHKDNVVLSSGDYLIFGHFYGECMGKNCIEIFRLEQNQLLEDTKDIYPNAKSFYDGNYIVLSQQKFNDAKDLINYFPAGLLTDPDTVIGQPDAGDWGGLYIEYNYNGKRKFWLLDQMKSNVPSEYHNFIDKVNEKIIRLQ